MKNSKQEETGKCLGFRELLTNRYCLCGGWDLRPWITHPLCASSNDGGIYDFQAWFEKENWGQRGGNERSWLQVLVLQVFISGRVCLGPQANEKGQRE